MKKRSQITKKYSNISIALFWISLIITVAPIIIYAIIGFANGDIKEKVTLGITLIVAIILTVINLLFKYHIRSILWIMVLGVYFCIDNIMPLLIIVAVSTIVDEFLLQPLHKHYKAKAKINYEIDQRIE